MSSHATTLSSSNSIQTRFIMQAVCLDLRHCYLSICLPICQHAKQLAQYKFIPKSTLLILIELAISTQLFLYVSSIFSLLTSCTSPFFDSSPFLFVLVKETVHTTTVEHRAVHHTQAFLLCFALFDFGIPSYNT